MSDLFQLLKLQESLKHDYILFIELGPVRVPLNSAWSTSFFIRNSVFLSQIRLAFIQTIQIPQEFLQANRPLIVPLVATFDYL